MKVYSTKDIRNVAVLGHGSCGKTTLVEAAAYVTGVISRMGKVTDGTTIGDFAHTGNNTGNVCCGFYHGGFAAAAVAQDRYVANVLGRINLHMFQSSLKIYGVCIAE